MFDCEHHIYAVHEGPVTLKKDSRTFVPFEWLERIRRAKLNLVGLARGQLARFHHLSRQQIVDERLIGDISLGCEGFQPAKHSGIKSDGNELPSFHPQWRSPHPTHRGKLPVG